jgi:hypothetical protein
MSAASYSFKDGCTRKRETGKGASGDAPKVAGVEDEANLRERLLGANRSEHTVTGITTEQASGI